MHTTPLLVNFEHPTIVAKAAQLTASLANDREKLSNIFAFVRDGIRFGFPPKGDLTTASETLGLQLGQCNTEGTLFLALCKASAIPARLHFSLIDKNIQRDLFTGFAYWLMPPSLSHCWIEVRIER
jgi:transglutaminase-like putative cysteine protease